MTTDGGRRGEALAVELLYERAPELDAERIAARVRERLPGTVALADQPGVMLAHEDFPREFEDGRKAILTLIVPPDSKRDAVGAGDFDLSQSWAFRDGHEAVARATTTLLVAEMLGAGGPPRDRVRAFSSALRAVAAETGPLAVWSPAAQELLDPASLERHPLAGLVNVRMFDAEDALLMDTLGLHTLGLPDFQLRGRDLDERAVARHLLNLAAHAVDAEQPIEDFDTVSGPTGEERWPLELTRATVPPERDVFDIRAG
jgi:hypothetical protein